MNRGLFPNKGKRFFSPLKLPDRLWRPPSLLFNGQRDYFLWGQSAPGHSSNAEVNGEWQYTPTHP
jgi:hypothetical protein